MPADKPASPPVTRTQHYWDPITKTRVPIQVIDITHQFRLGAGGALAGATSQTTAPVKVISSQPKEA